jgi:hypothetical protein
MKLGQGHFDATERVSGGQRIRAFPCEKSGALAFWSLVGLKCLKIVDQRRRFLGSVADSQAAHGRIPWAGFWGWEATATVVVRLTGRH